MCPRACNNREADSVSREITSWFIACENKRTTRVQIRFSEGKRVHVGSLLTRPQSGPIAAIPPRDAVRNYSARGRERAPGIEFSPAYRKGIHITVHPATERRPGAAVPFRNAVGGHSSGGDKNSSRVEICAAHNKGRHIIAYSCVHPPPDRSPAAAVPFRG